MLETSELGETTAHKKPGSTVPESVHTYIGDGLVQPEALNKKAIQIINRVRDKLTGRDFLNEETLDVATQVELLIKQRHTRTFVSVILDGVRSGKKTLVAVSANV